MFKWEKAVTKKVLILENDLHIALQIAETLERCDAKVVGLTADKDAAFAIAEGEAVDCTALSDRSSNQRTAAALRACLGIPSILLP